MTTAYDEHLDDGALMRVIDEGGSEGAPAHLAGCRLCAARLEMLRRRAVHLSRHLDAADTPARRLPAARHRARPRRFSPALGVAAVLALLVATVAVPPVRALLIDGLRRVLPDQAPPSSATEPDPTRASRRDSSAVVSFAVTGATFRLSVEHPQQSGAVIIVRGSEALASASIAASTGRETLVVRTNGLRIVNAPASTTGYRITLPTTVEDVLVTLPNRDATRLPAPVTDSLVVPLDTRG